MYDKIIKRLEKAINNLESDDFIKVYPAIIDDLHYILIDYHEDEKDLTTMEKFTKLNNINELIYKYYAKLVQCYFRYIYDLSLNISETDEKYLAVCRGGYDYKGDTIYYSPYGTTMARKSAISFLGTLLHEGRHAMQQSIYQKKDVLKFPPYMIACLKEHLFIDSSNESVYIDNYNVLFYENDAEAFSKNELPLFMRKLQELYQRLIAEKNIPNSGDIKEKYNEVNAIFNREYSKESYRIDEDTTLELYGSKPIDSVYFFNDNSWDRLITLDLNLKKNVEKHPEIISKYPILRLLFDDTRPKNYYDILSDKEELMVGLNEDEIEQVNELYKVIMESDPVLAISGMVANNDILGIQEFIRLHPTILDEYPNQLAGLNDLLENTPNRGV